MPKRYENVLFECRNCDGKIFRVHKEVDTIGIFEPCPDCKKSCIRRLPEALDLELGKSCFGVACICCPRGKPDYSRKMGYMSEEVFGPLCTEIAKWNGIQPGTVRLIFLHIIGESIAHPHFCEWVDRLYRAGKVTTIVSTNAIPLTGKLASAILASSLHRLILSVDAVSEETYKKIRVGGDFDKVQKNVDQLLMLAKQRHAHGLRNPQIWVQLLKLNENEEEWLEFARKYTGNANLRVVTPKGRQRRPIPGLPDGSVFFKTVERFGGQYDGAREHVGWDGADKRRFTCDKPFKRASIWWDGRIPNPACCYAADEGPILGSVTGGQSLHGVWMGKPFWDVREQFLEYQNSKGEKGELPELCRDC